MRNLIAYIRTEVGHDYAYVDAIATIGPIANLEMKHRVFNEISLLSNDLVTLLNMGTLNATNEHNPSNDCQNTGHGDNFCTK